MFRLPTRLPLPAMDVLPPTAVTIVMPPYLFLHRLLVTAAATYLPM